MQNLKRFLPVIILLLAFTSARAQYVEQEEKEKVTELFPTIPFDSIQAKAALAKGTATIKGVAFTKPRNSIGIKPLGEKRIYANKMKVELYPVTPYLMEWYELRNKKENLKKRVYVYLSNQAYRYRLEAITNSSGKFTFPEMKPGKYYLLGTIGWTSTQAYDRYTGSGYNGYNTTNYYQREYYNREHSERLEKFVEVTKAGELVEIKLK